MGQFLNLDEYLPGYTLKKKTNFYINTKKIVFVWFWDRNKR